MNSPPINIWDYADEYRELREQILETVDRVFKSGRLILGSNVRQFESEMAAAVGVSDGFSVNSGTDALHLALKAAGIGRDHEVITVSNTAVPTVSAIVMAGARPVFVDIKDDDFLMDVEKVERAITPRTKCILPVHLYGQCVDMDPLMAIAAKHDLFVLEDCAQAQGGLYKGRTAGCLGHSSAFSFYPTKVLGAYGDGGWVGSNSADYVKLGKSLRMYGMEGVYYSERDGFNSRLDEVQAAILSLKLPRVEGWIARRRAIAARYTEALQLMGLAGPKEAASNRHAYYLYVMEHPDRDRLLKQLAENGINCNVSYPFPIHTMRGYAYLGYSEGDFPVTEAKAKRILSLPMYPYLTDDAVERVISTLRSIV
jgi:dTDP-3-amino-2,3,6-trideoxy-4-keto-D-glucose/dTDP-3-amino-3,4,6-trideoxy-alpha-D-glucose/dTDP-2,6-dideoxy-D-kanosamine transaminase